MTAADKWFSVYVPHASPAAGSTITTYESYLRLGSPDATSEASFLAALQASYSDASAQPAVQAAFGNNPTGGVVFYTEGDLVQFINGKSDTRVLNDSYVVHVLNKSDASKLGATPDATSPVKTYRTYLRLGKPNSEIEKGLQGTVPPGDLRAYVDALAPALTGTELTNAQSSELQEAVLKGDIAARTSLYNQALSGDRRALSAIDALRASSDTRATTVHDGKSAVDWATSSLQALHLNSANARRDKAIAGDTAARDVLKTRAAAGDPVARRKILEIAEGRTTSQDARAWASGALATIPGGKELLARFSLGDGVALYSDRPVTVTTPDTLKVTVGADSRTVLGPVYTETYDVSDEIVQQIKDGWITQVTQIPTKRLITASLTQREASRASWRTTKFDQAKALTYSVSDSGTFSLSSSYTFGVGLKLSNGLAASFDASAGVSVSVPLSFKVEHAAKRMETTWTYGKCKFEHEQDIKGSSVKIAADPTATIIQASFAGFSHFVRGSMVVMNAAVLAYTTAVVAIGNTTTQDSSGKTANIRQILETGEAVYITVSALNAVFLAASIVMGVIQLASKKGTDAANLAAPVQPSNILLNSAGIKLQCGASYIHIDPSGISIYGPQIFVGAPLTNLVPTYFTSNMTPTQIAEVQALMNMGDVFGD